MSKLRVYELAKELNIKPQDVLDSLKGTQYEVKTSSNSIDEDAQKLVRSKVSGAAKPAAKPAAETKPAGEAKAAETKPAGEAKAAETKPAEAPARPKKKASISAVFNPQNSKTNPGSRRQAYHINAKTGEARRPEPAARPAQPAKPAAPKPAEVKPAETKAAEVKATEVKAAEVKAA